MAHFSKPEVQYIGSTSGCGCDFPNVWQRNGEWQEPEEGEGSPDEDAKTRYNRERLFAILRETGEPEIELYGVWDGDFDFTRPPSIREDIPLEALLKPGFRFKEQGFYTVRLKP